MTWIEIYKEYEQSHPDPTAPHFLGWLCARYFPPSEIPERSPEFRRETDCEFLADGEEDS